MLSSYGYGQNIELTIMKNVAKSMTILMTMPPGGYGAMRIAQWSASLASSKATRCYNWVSAHAVLPRRPPWSTISNKTKKTLTKKTFT
jgi:hypothetical protein